MKKAIDSIKGYFLNAYESSSFIVRQKARVFMWFEIIGDCSSWCRPSRPTY